MRRKIGILVLALALVAFLGWLDHITGREVRSVLFYFLPIMLVAWTLERRYVVIVSIASAIAWGTAELLLHGMSYDLASIWNEASALTVFSVDTKYGSPAFADAEVVFGQVAHRIRSAFREH